MARPGRARTTGPADGAASMRKRHGGARSSARRATRAEEWRDRSAGGELALRLVRDVQTRRRAAGPKGPGPLLGNRFRRGKTGPRSATFACRWCDAPSTQQSTPGPTGEDELCTSSVLLRHDKIKARLDHVEKELERLTSVPVINAETGAETRERPPKRARDDGDAASAVVASRRSRPRRTRPPLTSGGSSARMPPSRATRPCAIAAEAGAPPPPQERRRCHRNDDAEERIWRPRCALRPSRRRSTNSRPRPPGRPSRPIANQEPAGHKFFIPVSAPAGPPPPAAPPSAPAPPPAALRRRGRSRRRRRPVGRVRRAVPVSTLCAELAALARREVGADALRHVRD